MDDKEQVVIISKLILFDKNNRLIEENLDIVDLFYEQNIQLYILARRSTNTVLKRSLPSGYEGKIDFIDRGNKAIKDIIKENRQDIIISLIGIVEQDAIYSFNTRIPLFNPSNIFNNSDEVHEKVEEYGLPFLEFQDIIDCYNVYLNQGHIYFNMNFNNQFQVYSLHNANSLYVPEEERRIKQLFQTYLKQEVDRKNQKIMLFILFNFIRFITESDLLEEIDYWGTFPSSDPQKTNTVTFFLKETLRNLGSKKPLRGPEILIRRFEMKAKRMSNDRLDFKADKDLETLIVNPNLVDRLEDKVVCIIDDYITNGYSAEATKHLLRKAGVKKIIFISFGKFGSDYYTTQYNIDGDISDNFSYEYVDQMKLGRSHGEIDFYSTNNSTEILKFQDLL